MPARSNHKCYMQNAIAAAATVNNARVAEDAEAQVVLMDFNPVMAYEVISMHVPGVPPIGEPVLAHLLSLYWAMAYVVPSQAVALTYI